MNLGLDGRVALVTGGGRDVGRAIARSLAAEGANVAINYHRSETAASEAVAEITASGGTARAYAADVTDFDEVRSLVDAIVRDFGRLDILVNNAGYVRRQPFAESGPADWRRQIDVCLYGSIHCSHAALPHIAAGKHGRIISLAGDSSRIGEAGLALAAAARAGVIALMKSLAKELGRSAVTANAIALGLVETGHLDKAWLEANRDKITRLYPLRRLGTPGDVGPIVAFLASDAAAWITGQVLSVNGGFSMVG
jgi:NAD(P)-dependent dehydrogenase (short-subunit alcohol dehydrogenase family)